VYKAHYKKNIFIWAARYFCVQKLVSVV